MLYLGSKINHLSYLEESANANSEAPLANASIIMVGAVILQLLQPMQAKTSNKNADKDFIPYILSQQRNGT